MLRETVWKHNKFNNKIPLPLSCLPSKTTKANVCLAPHQPAYRLGWRTWVWTCSLKAACNTFWTEQMRDLILEGSYRQLSRLQKNVSRHADRWADGPGADTKTCRLMHRAINTRRWQTHNYGPRDTHFSHRLLHPANPIEDLHLLRICRLKSQAIPQ